MKKFYLFFTLLLLVLFFSCNKDKDLEEKLQITDVEATKQEIINTLVNNGVDRETIRFSDTITKENALVFSSVEELQKFLLDKKSDTLVYETDLSFQDVTTSRIYRSPFRRERKDYFDKHFDYKTGETTVSFHLEKRFRDAIYLLFNVTGAYVLDNSGTLKNSNYTTYITGFTFAIGYNQIDYGYNKMYNCGRAICFEGHGKVDLNLVVKDLGTVYSLDLFYKCKISGQSSMLEIRY